MSAKKQKVNKGRLAGLAAAVLVIVFLIAGALFWGISTYMDYRHQKSMKETISAVIEKHNSFVNQVNSIIKPDEISEENFETLKKMALTDTDFSLLDQFDPEKRVEEAYFEQVKNLPNVEGDEKAARLFLNISQYDDDILTFLFRDPDRYDFVAAFPERASHQAPVEQLTEDLSSIPGLIQWDLRWGYYPYGDSDIAVAGCAPTCLSMVLSYLKQDPSITPTAVADYAIANDMYVPGAGSAHTIFDGAASHWGVQSEGVPVSKEDVAKALSQEKLLILNMVPGTFTRTGHFIVAYADENGKLKIHDPNSITRSNELWDYDDVLNETSAIWAFSKS
ncbi:MAG: C39 family peptidase [Erysipelotrichaceae bacterium]|nr:C39 family peptidase [Erysipelotrichaceae bacterium]